MSVTSATGWHGSLLAQALRGATDSSLARLAAEASEPAFEELVRRHRPALVAHAHSLIPGDRAEDIVQHGLTKAYLALRGGLEVEQPKAWLHRIVHNLALNEIRDNRRAPEPTEDLDEDGGSIRTAGLAHVTVEAAEGRQRFRAFVGEIGELPDSQRSALVKHALEGMSYEDIARQLHVSEGAVRQLIYRARHSLRERVGALIPLGLLRHLADAPQRTAAATQAGSDPISLGSPLAKAATAATALVLAIAVNAGDSVRDSGPASPPRTHEGATGQAAPGGEAQHAQRVEPRERVAEQAGVTRAARIDRGSARGSGQWGPERIAPTRRDRRSAPPAQPPGPAEPVQRQRAPRTRGHGPPQGSPQPQPPQRPRAQTRSAPGQPTGTGRGRGTGATHKRGRPTRAPAGRRGAGRHGAGSNPRAEAAGGPPEKSSPGGRASENGGHPAQGNGKKR